LEFLAGKNCMELVQSTAGGRKAEPLNEPPVKWHFRIPTRDGKTVYLNAMEVAGIEESVITREAKLDPGCGEGRFVLV
jgi:cbb3-type cytochrome oxidase subunit 1